jgi:pilus assembly protein Flp/PilA
MLTYIRSLVSVNVRKVIKSEEGASLVEYGLLVALIAVVCIAGITALGGSINGLFNGLSTTISGTSTGGAAPTTP